MIIKKKFNLNNILRILRINPDLINFFFKRCISRLFSGKVNDNLIIFGSSGGRAFSGNTKYLYNYLRKNKKFKLIWLAKDLEIEKKLRRQGINALYKWRLIVIKYLRKAKYIFVTHGVSDIIPIKFSSGTKIINTWHGVQNKRNIETIDVLKEYSKLAKILGISIENDKIYDYFITQSGTKKDKELIAQNFKISKKKIVATGYPRNDILFSRNPKLLEVIKKKYKIPKDIKRVLLYAPTFRDKKLTADFPLNNSLLKELDEFLITLKSILLMKAHINEKKIKFQKLKNTIKITQDTDIQELLLICDILITDYSSVYCDYLLLDRPILFFTYDYKLFMKEGRGFYYDFEKIVPGPLLFNGKELIDAIKNINKIDERYKEKRTETCAIYNKYIDGNSTQRLLSFLRIL